jgi:putative FmdB family regulatory protein
LSESGQKPKLRNQLIKKQKRPERSLLHSRVDFSREETMPLYAYTCDACEAEFELLVRSSDTPECPACKSQKLTQQVSRISKEIKYPAIARSWRRRAAAEGDLSNFSKGERGKL